jgi:hypothetical protein
MTAAARFKQADLTRALRAVASAGVRVGRIEIEPNGKIVILSESAAPSAKANPCDRIFANEG